MNPAEHRVINSSSILFNGVNEVFDNSIIFHLAFPLCQIRVHVISCNEIILVIDAVLFWFLQQPWFFPHRFYGFLNKVISYWHGHWVSWKVSPENLTGNIVAEVNVKFAGINTDLQAWIILDEKSLFSGGLSGAFFQSVFFHDLICGHRFWNINFLPSDLFYANLIWLVPVLLHNFLLSILKLTENWIRILLIYIYGKAGI